MDYNNYEEHRHTDRDFPVIFHYDINTSPVPCPADMHWHESIELLYFVQGEASVHCGLHTVHAAQGDLVIVNGSEIHNVWSITPKTEYYCLIADPVVYEGAGLSLDNVIFCNLIGQDGFIGKVFEEISIELGQRSTNYKVMVKAQIIRLMTYLSRHYVAENDTIEVLGRNNKKIQIVKRALGLIQHQYKNNISVDDLCKEIGISKYYFCRTFKDVTGKTVTTYLNTYRCQKAQKLLSSGECNVNEAAQRCGFNSVPYFCRMYKRYYSHPPSQEKNNG